MNLAGMNNDVREKIAILVPEFQRGQFDNEHTRGVCRYRELQFEQFVAINDGLLRSIAAQSQISNIIGIGGGIPSREERRLTEEDRVGRLGGTCDIYARAGGRKLQSSQICGQGLREAGRHTHGHGQRAGGRLGGTADNGHRLDVYVDIEQMHSGIPARILLATNEREGRSASGRDVRIAIQQVIADVGGSEGISGRGGEHQIIVASVDLRELVGPRRIGNRRCDKCSIILIEIDGHPDNARLARVLNTVAVRIVPDDVADGGRSRVDGDRAIVDVVVVVVILFAVLQRECLECHIERADSVCGDGKGQTEEDVPINNNGIGGTEPGIADRERIAGHEGGFLAVEHAIGGNKHRIGESDARDAGSQQHQGLIGGQALLHRGGHLDVHVEVRGHNAVRVALQGHIADNNREIRHKSGVVSGCILPRDQGEIGGRTAAGIRVAIQRVVTSFILKGQRITGRSNKFHEVAARQQTAEGIPTPTAGDGTSRGRCAASQVKIDSHTVDTALAGILHPVDITVEPHLVTDGRGTVHTRVNSQVACPAADRDGDQAAEIHVAIKKVVAALILGTENPSGAGRRNELEDVGSRLHVGETIGPACRTGGGGDQGGPIRFVQFDGHTGDARLPRILNSIGVEVFPNVVADIRSRRHDGDGSRLAHEVRNRCTRAVRQQETVQGDRERAGKAGGNSELDAEQLNPIDEFLGGRVGPQGQIADIVGVGRGRPIRKCWSLTWIEWIGERGGGADDVDPGRRRKQLGQIGTHFLRETSWNVDIDIQVARDRQTTRRIAFDRHRLDDNREVDQIHAGIPARHIFTGAESDDRRQSVRRVRIAIQRVVSSRVLGRDRIPVWGDELQVVIAGGEVRETVGSSRGRSGRGDQAAVLVGEEVDGDVADPGFPHILNSVTVGVVPHKIADGRPSGENGNCARSGAEIDIAQQVSVGVLELEFLDFEGEGTGGRCRHLKSHAEQPLAIVNLLGGRVALQGYVAGVIRIVWIIPSEEVGRLTGKQGVGRLFHSHNVDTRPGGRELQCRQIGGDLLLHAGGNVHVDVQVAGYGPGLATLDRNTLDCDGEIAKHPGIERGEVLTSRQREDGRLACCRIDITVQGVVGTGILGGEDRVRRLRELNIVVAWRDVGERIDTTPAGRDGLHRSRTARFVKVDCDPVDPRLARVLDTIAIAVQPNHAGHAADRRRDGDGSRLNLIAGDRTTTTVGECNGRDVQRKHTGDPSGDDKLQPEKAIIVRDRLRR